MRWLWALCTLAIAAAAEHTSSNVHLHKPSTSLRTKSATSGIVVTGLARPTWLSSSIRPFGSGTVSNKTHAVGTGTRAPIGTGTGRLVTGGKPTGLANATAVANATASSAGAAATNSIPSSPWTVTAHPDGVCQQSLNITNATFTITHGFPNFTTIHSPSFPGAASTTGGGYNVWWSIPEPNPGCRSMIMLPYTETAGTPGYPGGKEIVNAGHAGCYFGNVPVDTDLLLSFCCGTGDCTASSLNSTALLSAPTATDNTENSVQQEAQAEDSIQSQMNAPRSAKDNLYAGSPAARAAAAAAAPLDDLPLSPSSTEDITPSSASENDNAPSKRYYYTPAPSIPACTLSPGQPYSQAGPQVIVTSGQSCPDSPCEIAIAAQVSFSTTAISTTSQTITNTFGYSISIKEGVDFIAEAEVTEQFSYGFSKAVEHTTGTYIMSGNSTTITNTLSTMLGNLGAVTFTPVYTCYTGPLDCGKGKSDPITVCQPDLSGSGGQLVGEYDAVVFG